MFRTWMKSTPVKTTAREHSLRYFLGGCLLSESAALLYLVLLPASAKNALWLGLSGSRLAVAAGFVVMIAATAALLAAAERLAALRERLLELLAHPAVERLAALGVAAFTAASFGAFISNPFLAERLRPAFLLGLLISGLVLAYLSIFERRMLLAAETAWLRAALRWIDESSLRAVAWLDRRISTPLLLAGAAAAAVPFLFTGALRFVYPLGYAGLYTLIAEEIARGGFALPASIPFYGPGGMPMAYPPLGFYLMAAVTGAFYVAPFDYLRFAPPVFMTLAMMMLALITLEVTQSRTAALVAVLAAAGSQKIFNFQGTAAGVVRGLAYLLALAAVWLLLSAYRRGSWKWAALAGVSAGLAALTHLGVALFLALFGLALLFTHLRTRRAWALLAVMGAAGLVVVSGWVLLVASRYGWGVFASAFASHGNSFFLVFFDRPALVLSWLGDSLAQVTRSPVIWGAVLFGLLAALLERKLLVPLWFALVLLLVSENARYLMTLAAVLAGWAVARMSALNWPAPSSAGKARKQALFWLASALVVAACGWQELAAKPLQPEVGPGTLALAAYVQQNTPAQWTYLAVDTPEAAEWLPYLLRRTPAVGSWGAEWAGDYDRQLSSVLAASSCAQNELFACVERLMEEMTARPEMVILRSGGPAPEEGPGWELRYQNEDYQLWVRR